MSTALLAAVAASVCVALAAAHLDAAGIADRLEAGTPVDEGGGAPGQGALAAQKLSVLRASPLAMRAITAIVVGAGGLLVGGAVAAIVLGTVAVGVGELRARRAVRRAAQRREQAAPALARAMADALRGGASVRGALATAAADRAVPAALREETTATVRAIAVGSSLTASLERLADQGGPTLRLLCGTTAMHLEAGGALASALDRLASDGEAAFRIEEDRIAATAQARATVRVVAALPVLALLGAQAASSQFLITIASNPLALALLLLGFGLEAAAIMVSRLIVGSGR